MSDSHHIDVAYAKIGNIRTCKQSWTVSLYTDRKNLGYRRSTDGHRNYLPLECVSSPFFSPENDPIKWQLEFCPAVVDMFPAEFGLLYGLCSSKDEIKTRGPVSGEFTLSIINAEGENYLNIYQQHFTLSEEEDYDFLDLSGERELYTDVTLRNHVHIPRPTILTADGKPLNGILLPKKKLTVTCVVNYFYHDDLLGLIQHRSLFSFEAYNPFDGFEKAFLNPESSDVTISVKGKEYPAHKIILSSRSKVFEAMFKYSMKESKSNRIEVNDIDEQVFLEALRYIYTGKAHNLNTLAPKLLQVADQFDLEKLKIVCGNVLLGELCVETAVNILILADMCNAKDLKNQTIEFIKSNSEDVVKVTDSEVKKELLSRSYLLKILNIPSFS